MADKKVTELTTLTAVSGDDLLMVVNDPAGAPASRKINIAQFFGNISSNTVHTGLFRTSANSTIAGTTSTVSANLNITSVLTTSGITNLGGLKKTSGLMILNGTTKANTLFLTDFSSETIINNNLKANGIFTVTGNTTFSSNLHSVGNTTIQNLNVQNSFFVIRDVHAPLSGSNAANEGVTAGSIFYSNNHLYIATDANTIKRVALSDFVV